MDPRTVIGDDPLSQNDEVSVIYLINIWAILYSLIFNVCHSLKLLFFFRVYGNNIFVTMN